MRNELLKLAKEIEIDLDTQMIENFFSYKDLLKEWNKKINLTAIVDDREILLKHFIDSLTIEKYIDENTNVIDIGTGAGFPGIPLKIVRNDINLTLLDSLNKRLVFLDNVKQNLKLDNVTIVHGRAEDVGIDLNFREKYEIATARAVANLVTLSEYCLPFVKVGRSFYLHERKQC